MHFIRRYSVQFWFKEIKFSLYLQVTSAGYSRTTQMLGDLCGGKMLVILEGGYVFLNSSLVFKGQLLKLIILVIIFAVTTFAPYLLLLQQ